MSAADVIARKGRTITRRRFTAGSYVDGYYQPGAYTDTQIKASVQPLNSKELMLLPEGERSKQWIKAYTVADIQMAVDEMTRPDVLIVDGRQYEVQQITDWTLPAGGANLTHFEVNAVRVNEKTNINTNSETP